MNPKKINSKKSTPKCVIKFLKINFLKEKIFRNAKVKQHIKYRGTMIQMTSDLSSETMKDKNTMNILE